MNLTRPCRNWFQIRWFTLMLSLGVLATTALSFAAAGDTILPGDVGLTRTIQDVEFAGTGHMERFGYFLGSATGIYIVATSLIALLAASRNFAYIVLAAAALALRTTNPWIKEIIASPRPSPELVRVAENATSDPGSYGFPSGHAMGTVLLYGCMIYIAHRTIRSPRLRVAIQGAALAAIVITALSRIYSGAHWPSDVLGGLLWAEHFCYLSTDSGRGGSHSLPSCSQNRLNVVLARLGAQTSQDSRI